MSPRQTELNILTFLVNNPASFKEYNKKLSKYCFQYTNAKILFSTLSRALTNHDQLPTDHELESWLLEIADEKSFTVIEKDQLLTDTRMLYSNEVTGLTGEKIKEFLILNEIKEISECLSQVNSDNIDSDLPSIRNKLEKLGQISFNKEELGMSIFSEHGINEGLNAIDNLYSHRTITTGYPRLDEKLYGGFRPEELIMFLGPTGRGKAQPVSQLVLTPSGWRRIGELKVGDEVFSQDGKTTKVIGVFPQGKKKTVRISFTDNTSTECCDEHLWRVRRKDSNNWKVKSTSELIDKVSIKGGLTWHIPMTEPVEFEEKSVPLDPYFLGLLIGDGSFLNTVTFTNIDNELINYVRESTEKLNMYMRQCPSENITWRLVTNSYSPFSNTLASHLRNLNLWKSHSRDKFIPDEYKFNSIEVRKSILAGILDTDGHAREDSGVDYCCASPTLMKDVIFLVQSLGGTATENKTRVVNGVEYPRCYIKLPFNPFRLTRKSKAWVGPTKYPVARLIKNIEYINDQECVCIAVDNPYHTYLTNDCIVTHNTSWLINFAVNQVVAGFRVLYIALDNPKHEIIERAFACISKEPVATSLKEKLLWKERIRQQLGGFNDKFFIKTFPSKSKSVLDLIHYVDRLRTYLYDLDIKAGVDPAVAGKIDVIYVDYLEKLKASEKTDLYRIDLENNCDYLLQLGQINECAIVSATQANREGMKADDVELHHGQESIAKFNPVAVCLGISQTKEEKMSNPPKIRLTSTGKLRRASGAFSIPFVFDISRQYIYEDLEREVLEDDFNPGQLTQEQAALTAEKYINNIKLAMGRVDHSKEE